MMMFAGLLLAVVAFSVIAAAIQAGQPEKGRPEHQKLSAVPFTGASDRDHSHGIAAAYLPMVRQDRQVQQFRQGRRADEGRLPGHILQ